MMTIQPQVQSASAAAVAERLVSLSTVTPTPGENLSQSCHSTAVGPLDSQVDLDQSTSQVK